MHARPKPLFCLLPVALLALNITSVPGLGALASNAKAHQESKVTAWTRDNYAAALDLLFQERCAAGKRARWHVCIRIAPGYSDEIEYSLSVERRYDGTIFARITRAKGQSIHTQLSTRKKEHPHASLAELLKLIQLESQAGDQHQFPALARLADDFEALRLSPVPSDEIMMDSTRYIFRIQSFSGERLDLVLQGPGTAAKGQPQPLIVWAESTRQVLLSAFP